MGHDEHRLAPRIGAGKTGENILNATRLPISGADRRCLLDLRAEPKPRELVDDVVAHAIVIRGAHRMRALRDLLDVPHRALGGERRIGSRRRNSTRRPRNTENRGRAKEQQAEGDTNSLEQRRNLRRVYRQSKSS